MPTSVSSTAGSLDRPERVGGAEACGAERARRAGDQAAERRRAGSRRARSTTPTGAESETASDVVRARLLEAEEASPPPVVELAVSVGPNAPIAERRRRRRARRRGCRRATPVASDSAATWRTTLPLRPAERLQRPSSRTRLPTDESASSAASRNAAAAATIESARPRLCERFGRVDEGAADGPATSFALATSRLLVRRLDPLLDRGDRRAVVGADEDDVRRGPSAPESFWSCASGR